jgi:retron-type reverse transcriptase
MQEVKVNINDEQIEFLNDHHSYGFKDKSTLVRRAIDYLKKELEAKKLKKSAE